MSDIEMCERFREREFGLRHWKGLGFNGGGYQHVGDWAAGRGDSHNMGSGEGVQLSSLKENHCRPFHDGLAQEISAGPGCFHSNVWYLYF